MDINTFKKGPYIFRKEFLQKIDIFPKIIKYLEFLFRKDFKDLKQDGSFFDNLLQPYTKFKLCMPSD